jgi:restriction endonuclease S subunit
MSQVAALPIFVPPLPLQEKFADFVRQVDKSKFTVLTAVEFVRELKRRECSATKEASKDGKL